MRTPGSNLSGDKLLKVTSGGKLIVAGGTGNGYRLAELMGASNPSSRLLIIWLLQLPPAGCG